MPDYGGIYTVLSGEVFDLGVPKQPQATVYIVLAGTFDSPALIRGTGLPVSGVPIADRGVFFWAPDGQYPRGRWTFAATARIGTAGPPGPAGPDGPQGIPGPVGPPGPSLPPVVEFVAAVLIAPYNIVTGDGYVADSTVPALAQRVLGMATAVVAPATTGEATVVGEVVNPLWTWTPGLPVFLNGTGLSHVPPSSGFVVKVGVASGPTTLGVKMHQPISL